VLLAVVDVGDAVVMVLAHGRKAYTTSRTPWQKSNNTWRGHNTSTTMATPDSSSSSADVVPNHDQGVHVAACLRRCARGGTPTAGMTAWPCYPGLLAGVRSCRSSSMAVEMVSAGPRILRALRRTHHDGLSTPCIKYYNNI
jgi:hypothetical protein